MALSLKYLSVKPPLLMETMLILATDRGSKSAVGKSFIIKISVHVFKVAEHSFSARFC